MVKVASGSQTSFWKDPWCRDGTYLLDIYTRLYALEMSKECRVIDHWFVVNGVWCRSWSWRTPPRGRVLDDLTSLIYRLGNFTLSSSGHDKWYWTGNVVGTFKVSSLTRTIRNHILGNCVIISGSPVFQERCPLCDDEVEDIKHCLIKCSRVLPIWRKVWSRWNLPFPMVFPSFQVLEWRLEQLLKEDEGNQDGYLDVITANPVALITGVMVPNAGGKALNAVAIAGAAKPVTDATNVVKSCNTISFRLFLR
ncbi:hypothetical protein Tco_0613174 [Tanacetum coccineum]